MLRHEAQPGKLVAGLFLTATAVVYTGDARGAWETPWFVAIPLVVGGLSLAGATAFLTYAIRRRRAPGRPGPGAGDGPSTGQSPGTGAGPGTAHGPGTTR